MTDDARKEADALARCEVLIETNEGTYSAAEAMRKIGCGEPAFANYRIYESVGTGDRRVVGCDPDKAPGYARMLNRDELVTKRRRLAELRQR